MVVVHELGHAVSHAPAAAVWTAGRRLVEEERLQTALDAVGAERVVIGHTPTMGRRILERFDSVEHQEEIREETPELSAGDYVFAIEVDPDRPSGRTLRLDTLRHSYVDLDGGRRYATIEDFRNFVKLAYASSSMDITGIMQRTFPGNGLQFMICPKLRVARWTRRLCSNSRSLNRLCVTPPCLSLFHNSVSGT